MAGGRASTRTSYKEADSDDDWLAGVEPGATKVFEDLPLVKGVKGKAGGAKVRKRVGDTYGAGPRKKARKSKGKGKEKAKEDEDASPFSLDLLFRLPDDLFLEICGYLDGRDLLEFSRTCKTMRKTLFSPNSGYIWANSRRRDDIPLPNGIRELELAALLYSNACQICGANPASSFRRDIQLRFRSCRNVIAAARIRSTWPSLHPQATGCVLISPYGYLVAELDHVHHHLLELEEEDELAAYTVQAPVQGSRSRPRTSFTLAQSLVDEIVSVQKAKVKQTTKELRTVSEAFQRKEKEDTLNRKAQVEKKIQVLVTCYGWTDEQADWFRTWCAPPAWMSWKFTPPTKPPAADEAAWEAYRAVIQKELDRVTKRQSKWVAYDRHEEALRSLYEVYGQRTARDPAQLPPLDDLLYSPSLEPLLGPDSPTWDEATWNAHLPTLEQVFDRYQQELRVLAIRLIISATTGIRRSQLSRRLADYPQDKFEAAFFARPTSLFIVKGQSSGRYGLRPLVVASFPLCLQADSRKWSPKTSLRLSIDERQVMFTRMILDAAGLDEKTATTDDLDALGARFKWTNDNGTRTRVKPHKWTDMLFNLRSYGPSLKKIEAGELPEVKLISCEDADGDGKHSLDQEFDSGEGRFGGDDSASDVDLGSDSEVETDYITRRLQVDDGDQEDDEEEEGSEEEAESEAE
ncbi:hypothetical protein JCM10296v2_006456 [Rhodotorula toruloides]